MAKWLCPRRAAAQPASQGPGHSLDHLLLQQLLLPSRHLHSPRIWTACSAPFARSELTPPSVVPFGLPLSQTTLTHRGNENQKRGEKGQQLSIPAIKSCGGRQGGWCLCGGGESHANFFPRKTPNPKIAFAKKEKRDSSSPLVSTLAFSKTILSPPPAPLPPFPLTATGFGMSALRSRNSITYHERKGWSKKVAIKKQFPLFLFSFPPKEILPLLWSSSQLPSE